MGSGQISVPQGRRLPRPRAGVLCSVAPGAGRRISGGGHCAAGVQRHPRRDLKRTVESSASMATCRTRVSLGRQHGEGAPSPRAAHRNREDPCGANAASLWISGKVEIHGNVGIFARSLWPPGFPAKGRFDVLGPGVYRILGEIRTA
jgi:hypothetical protein